MTPQICLSAYHILPEEIIHETSLDKLNRLLYPSVTKDWKRGDIISLSSHGYHYRNVGKFIYDGKTLVNLRYDIDDYGSIPEQFKAIEEFPINYWQYLIDHNRYINIDVDKLKIKDALYNAIVSGHTSITFKYYDITYQCNIDPRGDGEELIFEYCWIEDQSDDVPCTSTPIVNGTVILAKNEDYPQTLSASPEKLNTFICKVPFRSYPIYLSWKQKDTNKSLELLHLMNKNEVLQDAKGMFRRNFDYETFITTQT